MFSIVCFVGLFLVAIGASSVEAEDTHLQTLSVNGHLYTLPSTSQILLDEQSTTVADPSALAPWLPANRLSGVRVDACGDASEAELGESALADVAATMPLQLAGRHVTMTVDSIARGARHRDTLSAVAVITAGLADDRLYDGLAADSGGPDDLAPTIGNL